MTEAYQPVPLPHRQELSDAEATARAREFHEELARRHTVRHFSDQPVSREVIEACIAAAATAPSGANQQPWHFAAMSRGPARRVVREAAETEERAFYAGRGGEAWLDALAPLGTDSDKPFLEIAPWLIVIFGERFGRDAEGRPVKNYYVPESVGIATGFLIAALHRSGLATLTHTPSPMGFLNALCGRPDNEKPYMLLVAGHPADGACVPAAAKRKKPLEAVASFL